jgi:hypothetical protein
MSDVYLIKGATLTAIADAIREVSPNDYPEGTTITPEEVGSTAIYSVYNQGYSEGIRTLWGSFALKGYIEDFGMYGNYPCPSGIYTDFAYTNDDGEVVWDCEEIDRIEINEKWVDFYSISGWNKYNDYGGWYGQDDVAAEHLRYQYIDILKPVQVSQELYEVLNNLISFDDYTPFDLGFDVGYNKGKEDGGVDLEALGALCEWQVTTDSDSWVTVTVFNYHQSYYLYCYVQLNGTSTINRIVVPPNSSRSVSDDNNLRADEEIVVYNVRWKASAT